MKSFLDQYSDVAYVLLRVVLAFLFMSHGVQRVYAGVWPGLFPIDIANVIEVIAGPLILVGLFTPLAAFIASGEMAIAYFVAHAPQNLWPQFNNGEISVALAFGFLYIATRGGGKYSLDAMMGKK